jgi:oxygen-independent coproporphyrinogen-3 oxidase
MILELPEELRMGELPPGAVHGLYVHVPFCFHKCHYCDFYSITNQPDERMERFVDRILAEAKLWRDRNVRPTTIFFGGGTPSLLPLEAMRRLLAGLRKRLDLSQVDEWTIEVNPATLNAPYADMLRTMGVNRLSFGAQSFNRMELARLERHHDPADVEASVRIARAAGFDRLNLDLIYAIPGQTLASWADSLEKAIGYETGHLSCYGLTYEPNTALAVKKRLGQVKPAEESLELEMMRHTRQRLRTAGLPPYEISNYAHPGQECRHNLMYWTGGNYIGLGPSAAAHIAGYRWKNAGHLGRWEAAVDAGRLPATDLERLTPMQRAGEWAMLTLRLTKGLVYSDFADYSGYDACTIYADQLDRLTKLGLLQVGQTGARLTEKGLAVADAVAGEFFL